MILSRRQIGNLELIKGDGKKYKMMTKIHLDGTPYWEFDGDTTFIDVDFGENGRFVQGKVIDKLSHYEQAEADGRIIVLEKGINKPMLARLDEVPIFDGWNNATGAMPNGTSWHFEAQAVIEKIATMAFGAGIFYQDEKINKA